MKKNNDIIDTQRFQFGIHIIMFQKKQKKTNQQKPNKQTNKKIKQSNESKSDS